MQERDFWLLTVHFHPDASKAGVIPFDPGGFPQDNNPAYYRPHTFYFNEPPTRAEFLAHCKSLGWTSVWDNTLLPILASPSCPWPMIDWMHKAGDADIIDGEGRKVGRIDIHRSQVIVNQGYQRSNIAVTIKSIATALRVMPAARRGEAEKAIRANENTIQERAAAATSEPLGITSADKLVACEIRKFLCERGLIGQKAG